MFLLVYGSMKNLKNRIFTGCNPSVHTGLKLVTWPPQDLTDVIIRSPIYSIVCILHLGFLSYHVEENEQVDNLVNLT